MGNLLKSLAAAVLVSGCGASATPPDVAGAFTGTLEIAPDGATASTAPATLTVQHDAGAAIRVAVNGCTVLFDNTGVTDPSNARGAGYTLPTQPACGTYAFDFGGMLITDTGTALHVETRINVHVPGATTGAPPLSVAQWYFRGDR